MHLYVCVYIYIYIYKTIYLKLVKDACGAALQFGKKWGLLEGTKIIFSYAL